MSNVKIQGTAITHQHRITVSAPVSSLCDLCHQFTANSPSAKWVVTQTPNVKCSNQFFLQPFIFVDKRYLFVSCRSVIVASYLASRCNVVWKKNYLQSISALLKFLLQHAVRIARSKVLLSVAYLLLFIHILPLYKCGHLYPCLDIFLPPPHRQNMKTGQWSILVRVLFSSVHRHLAWNIAFIATLNIVCFKSVLEPQQSIEALFSCHSK